MNKKSFQDIKHATLSLLNRRAYFSKELEKKLKEKNFEEELIEEIIAFCKEKEFINDAHIIEQWLLRWIQRGKGVSYIQFESRKKGFPEEVIEEKLATLYPIDLQIEKAQEHLLNYRVKTTITTPSQIKQKQYQHLIQKGFSSEVIQETLAITESS
jgi:regulatory protein